MKNFEVRGIKVFSSSRPNRADLVGDRLTEWLSAQPSWAKYKFVVTQSSDSRFHCFSITVIWGVYF